jgi:hypothetical protein
MMPMSRAEREDLLEVARMYADPNAKTPVNGAKMEQKKHRAYALHRSA